MAGIGFDADVVERLHNERTGNIRSLSYVKPILQSLRSYTYPALRCQCAPVGPAANQDGSSATGSGLGKSGGEAADGHDFIARWIFVQNFATYAGGLRFAPQASASDGRLDVCAFEHGSLFTGLKYLSQVILGRHQRLADCRMLRTPSLRISADVRVPVQLDGDPGGELPVQIEVLPARLRLIVPGRALSEN